MQVTARASHPVCHAACVQDNMAGLLRSWQRLSGLSARAVDTAGAMPAYCRSHRTVAFASIEEAAPAAVRSTPEVLTGRHVATGRDVAASHAYVWHSARKLVFASVLPLLHPHAHTSL